MNRNSGRRRGDKQDKGQGRYRNNATTGRTNERSAKPTRTVDERKHGQTNGSTSKHEHKRTQMTNKHDDSDDAGDEQMTTLDDGLPPALR